MAWCSTRRTRRCDPGRTRGGGHRPADPASRLSVFPGCARGWLQRATRQRSALGSSRSPGPRRLPSSRTRQKFKVTRLLQSSAIPGCRPPERRAPFRCASRHRLRGRPQAGAETLGVLVEGQFNSYRAASPRLWRRMPAETRPAGRRQQARGGQEKDKGAEKPSITGVIERSPESAASSWSGRGSFLSDHILSLLLPGRPHAISDTAELRAEPCRLVPGGSRAVGAPGARRPLLAHAQPREGGRATRVGISELCLGLARPWHRLLLRRRMRQLSNRKYVEMLGTNGA